MYYIYSHTNLINGKKYIGFTTDTKKRWQPSLYKSNYPFYKDIQKYGWDNFSHEVICQTENEKTARICESALMAVYETLNSRKGYNQDSIFQGNRKGKHHTESARKRISETHSKGNHPLAKKIKDLETGKVYDTMIECAEDLGIIYSSFKSGIYQNSKKYKERFIFENHNESTLQG